MNEYVTNICYGGRVVKLGSARVYPVGLGLAPTVDNRLDQLLWLANQAGHPTTRARIVGALIRYSPDTEDDLMALLLEYEGSEAEDALIAGVPVPGAGEPKSPGRRRLAAS